MFLLFLATAGCSTQVTRPEGRETARTPVKALQDFTVEMSPEAKQQLSDNVKFDLDALTSVLERTLQGRDLLAADGGYRLAVVVNDIRVRSTFSAVTWGFLAGDDHLRGEAVIRNLAGEPVYSFGVSASYALGGLGGGQDASRMNWLYEEFSEMIADELLQQKAQ